MIELAESFGAREVSSSRPDSFGAVLGQYSGSEIKNKHTRSRKVFRSGEPYLELAWDQMGERWIPERLSMAREIFNLTKETSPNVHRPVETVRAADGTEYHVPNDPIDNDMSHLDTPE